VSAKKKVGTLFLKLRTLKILSVVTEIYVKSGQPVGSKAVCENLKNSPSAATVRSEMSYLTILGLLEQPHISSGRVPSVEGYKLYLNSCMKKKDLSDEEKNFIYGMFKEKVSDPESIIIEASKVLSKITGCAVVFTAPSVGNAFVKEIKFVKIGLRTAMLILITSAGMVQNQIFNCGFEITEDVLLVFKRVIQEKFKNVMLKDLLPNMHGMIFGKEVKDIVIVPAFEAAFYAVKRAYQLQIGIEGHRNLFNFSNLVDAFSILDFVNNKEAMAKFLFSSSKKIKTYVGGESSIRVFKNCSVIVGKYLINMQQGAIATISSTRLDYSDTIAKLGYILDIVQDMFVEFLRNLGV